MSEFKKNIQTELPLDIQVTQEELDLCRTNNKAIGFYCHEPFYYINAYGLQNDTCTVEVLRKDSKHATGDGCNIPFEEVKDFMNKHKLRKRVL